MDTPDITLTSFRLSSTLEYVFSQQQMLNRQEQMPLSKTKGLYEIKFIEFSRIGFLWEIKFVPPLLFHLAGTHSSGATAPLGLLYNQQWLTGVRQTWPAKTSAGPANDGRLLGGRNGFFQAFSERILSLLSGTSQFPFSVGKATAHWVLAATHFSLMLFCWCLLMINKYF